MGLLLLAAVETGLILLFPDAAAAGVPALSRAPDGGAFWTSLGWGNTYHVLHPVEGILLIQILLLAYSRLDRPATQSLRVKA